MELTGKIMHTMRMRTIVHICFGQIEAIVRIKCKQNQIEMFLLTDTFTMK